MMRTFRVTCAVGVGLLLGLLAGCGELGDFAGDPELQDGPVCYSDADCVPDDCCGEATRSVHFSVAPECGGVQCSGSCPLDLAECGCAVPYCRDSRCQLAYTDCE